MQVGMIGLGRMGSNLARRLTKGGHSCVAYDVNTDAIKALAGPGIRHADSPDDFVAKLSQPRVVWIMVPAGATGRTVSDPVVLLSAGDIIVDGGNSYYRDDQVRAKTLRTRGIHYVDCGASGGIFGLERGYCLMIGGEDDVIRYLDPIFKSIAPGVAATPRTFSRDGAPGSEEHGDLCRRMQYSQARRYRFALKNAGRRDHSAAKKPRYFR